MSLAIDLKRMHIDIDPIQQIGPRQFILCFYSEIEKLEYLHRLVVSGKEGK